MRSTHLPSYCASAAILASSIAPTYAKARQRGRDLIAKFKDRYPAAMDCLERDLEECITYLRFPEAHHRRIRTTNRIERLNGEGRRRQK